MTTENDTPNPEPTAEELAAQAAAAEAEKNKAPLNIDGGKPEVAKPEAKPADGKPEGGKDDQPQPVVYNPTGDAALDMVLKFVGDLGYHPDNPAMAAAMNGDFTMLEAELAAKGVKGYEAYMKLGQKAYTETKAKTEARQKADREAVVGEVGGEENWTAIQKWAAENADENEKREISKALGSGGLQARMAAAWLKGHYDRANGVSDEGPGPAVTVSKGAPSNAGALGPREYAEAVATARREYKGGDFENSAVYKGLQARRLAYRG